MAKDNKKYVRFSRSSNIGAAPSVDRENHVVSNMALATTGEALGHNIWFDAETLRSIQALSAPRGLKSRFGHPQMSASSVGNTLGRVKDIRILSDGEGIDASAKAVGDLYLSPSSARSTRGNLRDYVETLADEDPDLAGFSIVAAGESVWVLADGHGGHTETPRDKYDGDLDDDGKPVDALFAYPSFRPFAMRACDLVDSPAANPGGMFDDSSHWFEDGAALADVFYQMIDDEITYSGVDPSDERIIEFVVGFFNHKGVDIRSILSTPDSQPGDGRKDKANMKDDEKTVDVAAGSAGSDVNDDVAADRIAGIEKALARVASENAVLRAGLSKANTDSLLSDIDNLPVGADIFSLIDAYAAAEAAAPAPTPQSEPSARVHGIDHVSDVSVGNGPAENFQELVDWTFGVKGAKLPNRNMRSAAELYVAITGDSGFHGDYWGLGQFASATTTSLPNMVVNTLNRIAREVEGDMSAYRWYEQVASPLPHDGSLNDITITSLGGLQELPVVLEGKTYTEAELQDRKERHMFEKRGMYVGVTMEQWRRDDRYTLSRLPRRLIRSAYQTRSARVAALFSANAGLGPVLTEDSKNVFDATHGNYGTEALTYPAWGTVRTRAWTQKDFGSGKNLAYWPTRILLGIGLLDTALTVFGEGDGPGGRSDVSTNERNLYGKNSEFIAKPQIIPVPDWDITSKNWYWQVDSSHVDQVHIAYGNDVGGGTHPLPEIFAPRGADTGLMMTNDTMPIKIRDITLVGMSGYEGIGGQIVP